MKPERHTPESAVDLFLERLGEPGPSQSEIDRSADRLLRCLETQSAVVATGRPWRTTSSRRWVAWAGVFAAGLVLVTALTFLRQADVSTIASVESGEISKFGKALPAEQILSAGRTGAVLSLADASQAEIAPGSTFSIRRRTDGLEFQLGQGRVIVTAAKRRIGHFYVRTKDCVVSVTGTVFSVRAEESGSRVSVLEGEVRVEAGSAVHALSRGDQIATSPVMGTLAIPQEIGWSPRVTSLVTMLQGAPAQTPATPPKAVIAGQVRGTDGSALPHVRVALADPERTDTVLMHITETGDDGYFRLVDVPPGRYFVVAGAVAAPTYYPATADPKEAKSISVSAGTVIGGVNLTLVTPRKTTDTPADQFNRLQAFRDAAQAYQDGIRARNQAMLAGTELPPGGLRGRVVIDGGHRWPDLRFLATIDYTGLFSGTGRTALSDKGTFVFQLPARPEMLPVDLRIGITGRGDTGTFNDGPELPDDYYVKSITIGTDDVLKKPYKVTGPTIPEAVITLGVGQRVYLSVRHEDGPPVTGVTVTITPQAEEDQGRLKRTGTTDEIGNVELRGVAPGDYTVLVGPNRGSLRISGVQASGQIFRLTLKSDQTLSVIEPK